MRGFAPSLLLGDNTRRALRVAVSLMLILAPMIVRADSAAAPATTAAPVADAGPAAGGFDMLDAMGYGMFVIFLLFAAWIIYWFYQKVQSVVGTDGAFGTVEEAVFERELVKGLVADPAAGPAAKATAGPGAVAPVQSLAAPASPPPDGAGAPAYPFLPPSTSPPPTAPAPQAAPSPSVASGGGTSAADWGRRLQALGVFDVIEGAVALPLPPDGVIWRLKNGASALVLPRVESEATMAHFAKRFDFVIAPTANGEALVLRRLEGQIAEWTRR